MLGKDRTVELMEEKGEPYKAELIRDLPEEEECHFYQQGEYVEFCVGPHAAYTSAVKAFKLLNAAGCWFIKCVPVLIGNFPCASQSWGRYVGMKSPELCKV